MKRYRDSLAPLLLVLLVTASVNAHPPGISGIELTEKPGGSFELLLTLSRFDAEILSPMDADRDGRISPAELEDARPDLEKLPARSIELRIDGVRRLEPLATEKLMEQMQAESIDDLRGQIEA